jgi:hypothetical protein
MELVPASAEPGALDGAFAMSAVALPTHAQRLHTIARAIDIYQTSERRVARYAPLAARLLEQTGGADA